MFCPAGAVHSTTSDYGSVSFALELDAVWMERFCAPPLPASPSLFDLGSVSSVMHRLHREFRQTDAASAVAIEGMALELLAVAMRYEADPKPHAPRWLVEARDILDSAYLEQITIGGVAARLQIHPVHLAATFRRQYGQGIVEYIRGRRIDYASRRLSDTDQPLAEIAQAAGFCDQSHFSRIFKRLTGLTPAAYRTRSRGNNAA
jgi:AraC family transcriptional regulator